MKKRTRPKIPKKKRKTAIKHDHQDDRRDPKDSEDLKFLQLQILLDSKYFKIPLYSVLIYARARHPSEGDQAVAE